MLPTRTASPLPLLPLLLIASLSLPLPLTASYHYEDDKPGTGENTTNVLDTGDAGGGMTTYFFGKFMESELRCIKEQGERTHHALEHLKDDIKESIRDLGAGSGSDPALAANIRDLKDKVQELLAKDFSAIESQNNANVLALLKQMIKEQSTMNLKMEMLKAAVDNKQCCGCDKITPMPPITIPPVGGGKPTTTTPSLASTAAPGIVNYSDPLRCPFKACIKRDGPDCYKLRVDDVWTQRKCPNGTVSNPLACIWNTTIGEWERDQTCLTEEEKKAQIANLGGSTTTLECRPSWKPCGTTCFKRFSNSRVMTFDECHSQCIDHLNSVMISPTNPKKNLFARRIGAPDNKYWVNLQLNEAGDGWVWEADGTPLTDDQARFRDSNDVGEEIFTLKSIYSGTIPEANSCVYLEAAAYWAVTDCDATLQCMCEQEADVDPSEFGPKDAETAPVFSDPSEFGPKDSGDVELSFSDPVAEPRAEPYAEP